MSTPTTTAWPEIPLTEEQEGLLYLHRMEPARGRYHVPVAFEITGELDVTALDAALRHLVRRHPLLTAVPGDATLLADPERPMPLTRITREALGTGDAVPLLCDAAAEPMDLDGAGLSRALLVTAAPDRHYLLIVVHHLALDGESAGTLVTDLWQAYTAAYAGDTPPGEAAGPDVYRQEAARRTGQLERHGERLTGYWREVITGGAGPADLPSDGDTGDDGTGLVALDLPGGQVTGFARQRRVGVFAVLLAAYLRTLERYARSPRVTVAVPVSTRPGAELDGVVGNYVNTVLVRSPENGELPAAGYVREVQAVMARAIDHSALPYPRIAGLAAGPEPLFDCVFTYQSWYGADALGAGVPGLRLRLLREVHQPVVGELTLEMFADSDRLRGSLRYARGRLSEETATAFAQQFAATVAALAVAPETAVHALADVPGTPMTGEVRAVDPTADVDRLLRDAARAHAGREALREGDRRWTYQELDDRVATLAGGLVRHGVRPGDTVGVHLPRSAGQVLAVLAVLRAGAVFVPLDPRHPPRRHADIAEQAGLALVVTTPGADVPAGVAAATLDDLDGPDRAPDPAPRPGDAAYILFTSGSTGRPKGVVVDHRAMVNHLDWSCRYFAVTPGDAMAFSGALSFDVTLHQLFVPLVRGARLVVVPEGEQHDPDAMARTLRTGGVTLLHVVPALLRLLTDSPALSRVSTLRAVVSAGEALTNNLRRRFAAAHPAKLYNAYGPTEATVYATVFDASGTPGRWDRQADVPIGRPLDNIDCHVLDEALRPVPPGAPGELCLSGVALAAGYHGDPARTAEQFREIDGEHGPVRLYRTGDLVRLLPCGDLSYLGRLDHQVKLNGFRVELGEVEAALLDDAEVRDAVAVVRRPDEGHAQLVVYVTPAGVDTAALREVVARRLPAYMVPTHLVALAELPRLPSGKVDRKALPEPRAAVPGPAAVATAPAAASGRVLDLVRAAWTTILGAPAGDDAHFFTCGGDSILAMRFVSELRRHGLTLDLRLLHDHPRLVELALALSGGDTPVGGMVPEAPAPSDVGAAPIQRWFLDTVRTDHHHWNQSVLLRLTAPTDPALLGMALQALVHTHPELSARLAGDRVVPGEPFAGLRPGDLMDTVTVRSEQERDEAIRDVQGSLDPPAGALIRARLLHDATDGTDLLLVVVHHLAVDGVSWRILLGDLDLAVAALHEGELPRLPVEHRSYRAWLAGLPGVAAGETVGAYWRTVVRRRHAVGALLRAAPAGVEGDSRRLERTLEPDSTAALLGPAPAALGVPVHDLLTGLVTLALARWRGCDPVTLDVETHGRGDDGALARTVGWFTALYPLVLDVDRTLGPAAHVRAAAAVLAAVPDGGASYGAVWRHAPDEAVRAELAGAPAALVSFNYLGRLDAGLAGDRFAIAGSAVPGERSARAERPHTVELYGLVRDGRLTIGATYTDQPVDGVGAATVNALLDHLAELCRVITAEADEPAETPITPQQYGILVDSLARPGAGRYLEQLSWVWEGPLDLDRFTAAWAHVAGRHAALRSSFRWDGRARVVVEPRIAPEVRVVTDRPWSAVTAEDRARDFDLARAPLFRLTVQPGEGVHQVLFTFHHALLDGWSTALVLEDFYRAYLGGTRAADPGEPDARDHARWLAAQNTTDAEAFWSSRLSRLRPLTRPGVTGDAEPGAGAGRHQVRVPRAGLAALTAAAAGRGATESTVLQGLWALLLWRAAGTADAAAVCFGVTSSGRAIDLPGADRIAGLLMTTLPLTVEVRPDEPVLDLLARTRAAALEMTTFEWVATGQVHDWSGHRGGTPLFESLLVVENYPSDLGDVGALLVHEGIRIHGMSGAGGETAYPCTLLVHSDGDESVLTVVHDRRTVGDDAARRIGDLWSTVLRRLGEHPGTTVAELAGAIGDDQLPVLARPAVPVQAAGPSAWPEGPHTETIREVWCRVLGVPEVAPGDHFFDSGGHSLLASRFLREIQESCGRPVRLDDLLAHPTAGGFAQAVAGGRSAERSTVVPLAPGSGSAVYLVHPPGGQVACYGELARHYPGPEPLFGLRDPRADRPGDPPRWTVRELAEHHLREMGHRTAAGRMVLGGFSGGGVVAHEMARLLHERTGATPLVLIIDAAAPTGRVTDTAAEGSFLRRVHEHDRDGGTGDGGTPEDGDGYLDELATVAEWMRGAGQGDPYALLASTLEAVERHEPQPYPGPVVVLRAGNTDVGDGEEFAVDDYYARPDMGWAGLCGELDVRTVAGNHITLLTAGQARELAGTVAAIVRHHEKGGNAR